MPVVVQWLIVCVSFLLVSSSVAVLTWALAYFWRITHEWPEDGGHESGASEGGRTIFRGKG